MPSGAQTPDGITFSCSNLFKTLSPIFSFTMGLTGHTPAKAWKLGLNLHAKSSGLAKVEFFLEKLENNGTVDNNLCFTFLFFCFIRHSSEFLCRRVFQYLEEPISSLLFSLLRRMNIFCRFRCGECRCSKSG